MNIITCPICQEEHEEGRACPRCSFEFHHVFSISKHFQEIEQKRIAAHSEWWQNFRVQNEQLAADLSTSRTLIAEHEQTIASKEKTICDLQQEFQKEQEKCFGLEAVIQQLDKEVQSLKEDITHLRNEIEEKNQTIKELEDKIASATSPAPEPFESNQPFGYIIVKFNDKYTEVHPFYKGTVFVGRNPKDTKEKCFRIRTKCMSLQDKHFSLTVTQDERVLVHLMDGCNWKILGQGTQAECEISNGSIITIGNLTIIINFV